LVPVVFAYGRNIYFIMRYLHGRKMYENRSLIDIGIWEQGSNNRMDTVTNLNTL